MIQNDNKIEKIDKSIFLNKYGVVNIKTEDIYKECCIMDFENLVDLELKC